MKKISVVIPCYNEGKNVINIYKELDKVSKMTKDFNLEIIYVNDGSRDNTIINLRNLAKKDRRVRYLSFSRNFGKEAAMAAGFKYSTGDYVTVMDCDLQDPPELLLEMFVILENTEYDCCALYCDSYKNYSFIRRICTKLFYKIYSFLSSYKSHPGERDCRLMTRNMVNSLLELCEYNRYVKGIYNYVGYSVCWIKYDKPDRAKGKSKFSLIKLFKYAIEGITSFSTKPLLISAFVGILFCLISFIAIIFIIIKTLLFGDPVSGWPSLACIVIFVSGVQLFFLGIIGLYLSKLYLEVKNRPLYIIKEKEKDLFN